MIIRNSKTSKSPEHQNESPLSIAAKSLVLIWAEFLDLPLLNYIVIQTQMHFWFM